MFTSYSITTPSLQNLLFCLKIYPHNLSIVGMIYSLLYGKENKDAL